MLTRNYKISDINRVVLYMQGEYALNSIYYSTHQQLPNPVLSSDWNSSIFFYSHDDGKVVVDWDDGNVETFDLQYNGNYYVIGWRSQDVDYRKNPASTGGGWGLGIDQKTKEYIRPKPNHRYTDGSTRERHITFTFNCKEIYSFSSSTVKMWGFPILELPNLETLSLSYTSYIHEIPFVRLSKIKKLTSLNLTSLGSRMQYIPDSILSMTRLKSLAISGIFDLSNPDSSNFRKINQLVNLESLTAWVCNIQTYIKELNDLPKLKTLIISNANAGKDGIPKLNEVSQINQNLTSFNVIGAGYSGGGVRTSWLEEELSGKGLQNIRELNIEYQNKLTLTLPEYLKEMNALTSVYGLNTFMSQTRADTFVNNMYAYITGWNQTTMTNKLVNGKRNQFYGLSVTMYAASYPNDYRPSGILQAPSGFVKGSSNGNPTTPMEKIYVLQQNYAQRWTVKPS